MFLLFNFRQSTNGTIEPDMLPTTNSAQSLYKPTEITHERPSFSEYITDWNLDWNAKIRKLACMLAVFLHVPMNVLSVLSYGFSLLMFFGITISVLNLLGVGVALWRLDVMRGRRLFFGKIYDRAHFDCVVAGLVVVYGFSFGMFVFARMSLSRWVWFLRIMWPCLIATDVFAFIAGWVATWADVSV